MRNNIVRKVMRKNNIYIHMPEFRVVIIIVILFQKEFLGFPLYLTIYFLDRQADKRTNNIKDQP